MGVEVMRSGGGEMSNNGAARFFGAGIRALGSGYTGLVATFEKRGD
jgi:hypothetical protein